MIAQPFGSWIPLVLAYVLVFGVWLGLAAHAAGIARYGSPIVRVRWLRLGFYVFYILALQYLATNAALWVRQNVAEPFREPSGGMFPSLWVGDHFLANTSSARRTDLKRGDIVVFTVARDGERHVFPADERPDLPRESFVKRIIGLPGDSIEFRGGEVVFNGRPLPRERIGEIAGPSSDNPVEAFRETLDGRSYTICLTPDRPTGDFPRVVVPPDRIFLVGDNRDASFDSRFWGTVRREEVKAIATHIYFARDPRTGEIHWNRFGRVVQ
jgi:signal peptidase I